MAGEGRPMRLYYPFLDILRVVACFLVILLHVSAMRFDQFEPGWLIAVSYNGLSRMCVPLFFLISGFLLLDSDISSLGKFYGKRYARILLPFAFVCLLYYFTPLYAGFTPAQYLWHICNFFVDYHLWYVYVSVGIYFALPFFIKVIHGEDGLKFALVYVCVWFLGCILFTTISRYFALGKNFLAAVNYIFPNGGMEWMVFDRYPNAFFNFNFKFFYGFTGYLICGWLVKKILEACGFKTCLFCAFLFVAATGCIIYFSWSHSQAMGKPNELFFENLTPFVFLQAMSFFILCARLKATPPWLCQLADLSFWIYLLHLFWLRLIHGVFPLQSGLSLIWSIPAMSCAVFAGSYFCAIPLRKLEKFGGGIFWERVAPFFRSCFHGRKSL